MTTQAAKMLKPVPPEVDLNRRHRERIAWNGHVAPRPLLIASVPVLSAAREKAASKA